MKAGNEDGDGLETDFQHYRASSDMKPTRQAKKKLTKEP